MVRPLCVCPALALLLMSTPAPLAGLPQTSAAGIHVSLRARSFQPGEMLVVAVRVASEVDSVRVSAFDRRVPAYRTGPFEWEALVGIDLDQPPGAYRVTAEAGTAGTSAEHALTVAAKRFPVRTLRVNPDFVNPPKAIQARIARESALVQQVYANPAAGRLWSGAFVRPVPHQANSRFGSRSVFNGEARNPHSGTDFLSPAGTPIRAPNAGRIAVARELFFSGRIVIIDHGLGLFSQLAHMSRIDVEEGDMVDSGQTVGIVGATGRVTGAHLHWGLRVGDARVDPLSLVELTAHDAPR
jgi:murein DD-endopeptidase MepM/ murein hydrolase activator NlpD